MNIQPISFTAKKRSPISKTPRRTQLPNSNKATQEPKFIRPERTYFPWDENLRTQPRYSREELTSLATNAVSAVPSIKKAADFATNKSREILTEVQQVQVTAEVIYEKIQNKRNFGLYPHTIKHDKKTFDVKIYPERKIVALERVNDNAYSNTDARGKLFGCEMEKKGKDVYEFDIQTGVLTYFAHGHKKEGYVTSIEKEFKFQDEDLYQYNEGVSKGEFNLISRAFAFDKDEKLHSFSTMTKQTWNKDVSERMFVFNKDGQLEYFARDFEETTDNGIKAGLKYTFKKNGDLDMLEKDLQSNYSVFNETCTRLYFN